MKGIFVSVELLERASNLAFQTQHYPLHEELRAILSAPSPAGVDGLSVVANNVPRHSVIPTDCSISPLVVDEADFLRVVSAAQAIIDGLRGEVDRVQMQNQIDTLTEWYANALNVIAECSAALPGVTYMDQPDGGDVSVQEQVRRMRAERDQQAQRIGELKGLLRHAQKQVPTGSGLHMRIDAALASIGKEAR